MISQTDRTFITWKQGDPMKIRASLPDCQIIAGIFGNSLGQFTYVEDNDGGHLVLRLLPGHDGSIVADLIEKHLYRYLMSVQVLV